MTHDDRPQTPAQARRKLQKGLEDYLDGIDTGPIVFRLKRNKKRAKTYPLKLTVQQRETLLEFTQLSRNLKKKIEQAEDGTQIVPVTWNELHKLNDETGQAAYYARSPHKRRLMAVMERVNKFFEEEHAEVFALESPNTRKRRLAKTDLCSSSRSRCLTSDRRSGDGFRCRTAPWSIFTSTSRRHSAGKTTIFTNSRSTACGTATCLRRG